MKSYLKKEFDWNDYYTVNQYDELSLWSAPFGMLLLENMPLNNYKTYLDIGTGTGFPLIDIKQRLNNDCKAYGIDPWKTALKRAQEKINALNLQNIELIEGSAEKINFENNFFDFMTSNLGMNNFENQNNILKECYRVIKPHSPFCITTNLTGQFLDFFNIFEKTLKEVNLHDTIYKKFIKHINHRGTQDEHKNKLLENDFKIKKEIRGEFYLRYLNGSVFLNNSVIMSGFLPAWKNMFDEKDIEIFYNKLEDNLNIYSDSKGELKVNVPMLYLECYKE